MTYPYTRATFGAKDTAAPAGGAIAASLPSCRLWSLWEMLEFNAPDFYEATTNIQHTLTHIQTLQLSSREEHSDGSVTISPITNRVFLNALSNGCVDLKESLTVLGARLTIIAVDEMLSLFGSECPTYDEIVQGYRDISATLRRELTLVKLLALSSKEQELYSPPAPLFGKDFEAKFPSAIFELDEAAKCLALSRSTASVFHLMRIMEIGIRAVALCLGIPEPVKPADRNWGNILRSISDDLKAHGGQHPTKKWAAQGDREFFEGALASLDAVRVAWRNPTMHVEIKNTVEEAEHVFGAVKGFMRELASRMDEHGEPKA